ncbi:MAG: glycosyltransferase family 2 protein [Bdellovibrionales bacterium]|jgi:glycosyltransferase involved in cell wall biosynthesis
MAAAVAPLQLSALVVAHNEAAQLATCLDGLSFCDEIVVVLDRCTDGSRDIAAGRGAKIIEGAWEIEGARRQAGQAACAGRWVFEVDADERVPAALAKEIRSVLKAREAAGEQGVAFWRIPFDNYIGDRLVRYGWGASFGVSAKAILYRKGIKHWGAQRVHPKVLMDGVAGEALTTRMAHYVDNDVSDMIQRLDRYTTLHARDMVEEGDRSTLRKNVARILGRFYKCYVLRKGYREGALGIVIAVCAGLYPFLSYVKAQELTKK